MVIRIFKILINLVLLFSLMFSAPPAWDCDTDGVFDNAADYESNGSITAAVYIDGVNAGTSEGDLLGAFVGDELRGIGPSTPVPFGPNAGTYAFLTLIYLYCLFFIYL